MIPSLTKAEIRTAITRLLSLAPPGPRPLAAAEIVEVNDLVEKLRQLGAAQASMPERGTLVLSWRLPKDLVPTQNDLRGIKPWRLKKIKASLLDSLTKILPSFPNALTHGSTKRRWVRTTRFTTTQPDELACDANGFKCALDILTEAGCIASDDPKSLHREPCWEKCKPGGTSGLVELFLFADEQVATVDPAFAPVQQVVHVQGLMTTMLKTGGVK